MLRVPLPDCDCTEHATNSRQDDAVVPMIWMEEVEGTLSAPDIANNSTLVREG